MCDGVSLLSAAYYTPPAALARFSLTCLVAAAPGARRPGVSVRAKAVGSVGKQRKRPHLWSTGERVGFPRATVACALT